jgi:hypothetical protein
MARLVSIVPLPTTERAAARALRDEGTNPFGECASGHRMFRGGCPDCSSDMVADL